MFRARADGYLLKADIGRLVPALSELASGGSPVSARVAAVIVRAAFPAYDRPPFSLTEQEQRPLECLSRGLSYAAAAKVLGRSVDAVRTYVRSLYPKMGADNRAQAVNLGWSYGLLRPPPS